MTPAATLFEKIWRDHVVKDLGNNTFLLHIDRNFLHEVSGAISFKGLEQAGRTVRRPELTWATLDHVLDTFPGRTDRTLIPRGGEFIGMLRKGTARWGIPLFDLDSEFQGIVHVISPELGIALPGSTLVCGDSHTCTVGGIGALAWGIGSTDSEHVLATQTLVQTKPGVMRVDFDGTPPAGVTPKDLILHLIGRITADGGNGYAIEYAGSAVSAMPVEGRITICNMASSPRGPAWSPRTTSPSSTCTGGPSPRRARCGSAPSPPGARCRPIRRQSSTGWSRSIARGSRRR